MGDFATDPDASGQSLVAALAICCENAVIAGGSSKMQTAIEQRMERARNGDETIPETLAKPGGGLAGATILGKDINFDELEKMLGKYMAKKVRRSWPEKERGPGMNMKGEMVVNGLQLGNIWSKLNCATLLYMNNLNWIFSILTTFIQSPSSHCLVLKVILCVFFLKGI